MPKPAVWPAVLSEPFGTKKPVMMEWLLAPGVPEFIHFQMAEDQEM